MPASVSLFCWLGDATLLPAALLPGECTSFILIFILLLPCSFHLSSPFTHQASPLLSSYFFLSLLSYIFRSFLLPPIHSFIPYHYSLLPFLLTFFILPFLISFFVHAHHSLSLAYPSVSVSPLPLLSVSLRISILISSHYSLLFL